MSTPPAPPKTLRSRASADLLLVAGWAFLLCAVLAGPSFLPEEERGPALTRWTVRLSLLCYTGAVALILVLRPEEFRAHEGRGRLARWLWTLGLLSYLVHLSVAFHFYHHWSHEHAVERVRQASGFGPGIWMSHLFTVVWTADVLWWWLRPESYARRPAWIDRAVQMYLAFIVFNATLIFESGPIRPVGAALFAFLAVVVLYRMRRDRLPVLQEDLSS